MSPKLMDSIITQLGDSIEGADGRTYAQHLQEPIQLLVRPGGTVDETAAKTLHAALDSQSDRPIVIEASVHRWNHNRELRCLQLADGPAYVMCHFPSHELYAGDAWSLLLQLSELGHRYTVRTKYIEVPMIHFCN